MNRSIYSNLLQDPIYNHADVLAWRFILQVSREAEFRLSKNSKREMLVSKVIDDFSWQPSVLNYGITTPPALIHQVLHYLCELKSGPSKEHLRETILFSENIASSADCYFSSAIVQNFGPKYVKKNFRKLFPFYQYIEINQKFGRRKDIWQTLEEHEPFELYKKVVGEVNFIQNLTKKVQLEVSSKIGDQRMQLQKVSKEIKKLEFAELSTYFNHLQQLLYANFYAGNHSSKKDKSCRSRLESCLVKSVSFVDFLQRLKGDRSGKSK